MAGEVHEPLEDDADVVPLPVRGRPDDEVGDPSFKDLLGEVLRDERLRQGRTLADVAGDAAVSVPYLSEVERGRKDVSSDLLHAIHSALGLDLGDVLERVGRRLPVRVEGRRPSAGSILLLAA